MKNDGYRGIHDMAPIRVTIWNEFIHERNHPETSGYYPDGIHTYLAQALASDDFVIRTATQHQDAEHGLGGDVLDNTDVLLWWSHGGHKEVSDAVVERIAARVHAGMGFIPLHSAHASKPFTRLMGTPCALLWREANERARIWTADPTHPIAQGVPLEFVLEHEEMYGEVFQIPKPDDIVFITWFQGGNVFRGGVTFTRGMGKIFYFHPGHETLPSFHNPHVQQVLKNAIRWAKPTETRDLQSNCWVPPLESLDS